MTGALLFVLGGGRLALDGSDHGLDLRMQIRLGEQLVAEGDRFVVLARIDVGVSQARGIGILLRIAVERQLELSDRKVVLLAQQSDGAETVVGFRDYV